MRSNAMIGGPTGSRVARGFPQKAAGRTHVWWRRAVGADDGSWSAGGPTGVAGRGVLAQLRDYIRKGRFAPRIEERAVPQFRIIHRHAPQECDPSLASWQDFASPLRRRPATSSCAFGRHQVWWDVEAADVDEALTWLPDFVRARIDIQRVEDLALP